MQAAIKELLYKMGDDALILGHRNSEWTGIGPTLEEDIAFSSMAQDKLGHAWAAYTLLHEHFGEPLPDALVFQRKATDWHCCQLVELPIGDYDFSLIRHFLYDHADALRYQALQQSSYTPLAQLATKIKGELKYHTLHADVWTKLLGNSSEEAKARLQNSLNQLFPYALGIFEPSENEQTLIEQGIFVGEDAIKQQWLQAISAIIAQTSLQMPTNVQPIYGGRKGYHTEYLQPMLNEMTEVSALDPSAEW